MLDDITQAVLAHDEVARYLRGGPDESGLEARERVQAYIEELRTTQRYPFYRALKHPLYPILRKITRVPEAVEIAETATGRGRVIYASNHKSHLDYLIEPLILDDHGIRPPLIAAGINLFGGALGLLHRHVTGAIPIRRNTKDPAYLVTLKAYVAELLKRHDFLVYLEGGRSYNGAMKTPKTGLLHAALQAGQDELKIVPMAVAYDFVLEDQVLAHQGVKRQQRPFARELAEMVRYGVGYRSRAFVTFGAPVPLGGYDPCSRREVMGLASRIGGLIGKLHKVLPTALVSAAMRPSIELAELTDRIDGLIEVLRSNNANLAVSTGQQALNEAIEPMIERGIVILDGTKCRVRERIVLRYYARSIQHLLSPRSDQATH